MANDKSLSAGIDELDAYRDWLDSHAMISKTNLEGQITFVNQPFVDFFGFSEQEMMAGGYKLVNSGFHSKDFFEKMWLQLESGGIWRGEICNRSKNGKILWLDTTIFPLKDANGSMSGYVAIKNDVSMRKEKEILFNEMQKIGKIGAWVLKLENNDLMWTEETYRIHEIEIGARITTTKALEFYPEHERNRITKLMSDCINFGTPYEAIFEFVTSKGNRRWVRTNGKPEHDNQGKVRSIYGTLQDISDAKEAESELAMVLKSTQMGIWKFNPITMELFWDKSMYELYEVNPASFSGAYDAWLSTLHEQSAETAPKEFEQSLAGTGNFEASFKINSGDGEIKEIGARAIIERDEGGKATFVTGVNWDRTREQNAIDEMNKQIRLSQHNSKLASIGELAAGVGHEINNPLAIIQGYITLLEHTCVNNASIGSDFLAKYLVKIETAIDRISKIVNGLRTFSRSDSGDIFDFDPIEAICESYEMVREIYHREGIDIVVENKVPFATVAICGNRGQLQQIFMNLVTNARDASESAQEKVIRVKIDLQGDTLKLSICDNGCGIPDEIRERIFDPFFTTKAVNQGTGIGLSLVHNFVKEMKGGIEVFSEMGTGTSFVVSVPVKKAEPQKVIESPPQQKESKTPGRILLVDDEVLILETLGSLLEYEGFSVTLAENGQKALDTYRESTEPFDIVITDMKMPNMDGAELLQAFRSEQKKLPKFVLMTGGVNTEGESLNEEIYQQVDGYFFKPFQIKEVMNVLKKCLHPSGDSPNKVID